MKRALLLALIALAATVSPAQARRHHTPRAAPAIVTTNDLAQPVEAALKAAKAGRRVIVVFDIDNTLLTTPQDLGGDAWYNWEKAKGGDNGRLIADDTLLLAATRMTPTQADAAALIGDLQAHHVVVYALSARSEMLRGTTLHVLSDNGIDLSAAPECGPPLCTRRGMIGDRVIRAAEHSLHIKPQAARYRDVTVSDGMMLVAGQDKGVMLRLLLASLKHRYDDVWFVDDTWQNVVDVRAAAPAMTMRVHPYSYERMRADADAFTADTARQAKSETDMARFKAGLCDAIRATICP